jgi:pimeloyl-ACP methyl ester carboxylesterase
MARFVLVHGAFSGAWSWERMLGPLRSRGHVVDTLDLPGAGDDHTPVEEVTLARYAAAVVEVLERRPEPAVLVGCSMGGIVITQAASDAPARVASLIFVCAFMPADGQSLLDLTRLPEGKDDQIQANLVISGDPPVATMAGPAAAAAAVFNRCTPEQTTYALARRRPQPVAPFSTPVDVDEAVLAAIPRSYVLTTADRSLPPALQRRMVREHPCQRVVELDTGHAPYLSMPDELAALLIELAEEMAADGTSDTAA